MSLYVDKFELDNQEILIRDTETREIVNNLNNKRYLFIGDSYLKYGDGSDPSVNVTTYLPIYMGLSTDDYYVSANGGASFSRSGNTFLMLLQDAYNSLVDDPETITDIVCLGGYNDQYQTYETITGAINTFCTTAKTLFPNAKIKLGFLGWNKTNDSLVRQALIIASQAWQSCGKYGAMYITNSECINHDYRLYNSSVHPSADGAKNMAMLLSSALLSNSGCDVTYFIPQVPINIPSGETIVTAVSGTISQFVHNNILTLASYANIDITLDNATIQSAINLFEFPECLLYSIPDGFRFSTNAIVKQNGTWSMINGYFRFNRQILQFIPSINLSSVTNIRLMAFTLSAPTILN